MFARGFLPSTHVLSGMEVHRNLDAVVDWESGGEGLGRNQTVR